jgi:RHH-type proline utilization regulon transcriptional repressor/proline dehydrogenase/delta 1-pyrroline-5-carboxylate dehydrogenase
MTKWENRTQEIGQELFGLMRGQKPGIFNKAWWQGQVMEWSMKDEAFKTEMFRFVDVFPVLQNPDDVYLHLQEYLLKPGLNTPKVIKAALKGAGLGGFMKSTATKQIIKQMEGMAKNFICGEDGTRSLKTLKALRKQNQTFTVDLLGEATVSEEEADDYVLRYQELIDSLSDQTQSWSKNDHLDTDDYGVIPRVNVSIKVSAMYSQLDALAFNESVECAALRLLPLFQKSAEKGVFLNLDMEHYAIKDLTYAVFKRVMSDPSLDGYEWGGVVVQAYLRDSEDDLRDLIRWAKKEKKRVTLRLVKGAYWDYETIHATQEGWPSPVWLDKADSDVHYEKLTAIMLENHSLIRSAIGSHNLRSIAVACAAAEYFKVPKNGFEIQCLYGMAEPIKAACFAWGLRVRIYAPVGELIPGMAYLVRRLLENTSNEGWLKQGFADNVDSKILLAAPQGVNQSPQMRPIPPAESTVEHLPPFCNEPLRDFTHAHHRQAFTQSLDKVQSKLGKEYSSLGPDDGFKAYISSSLASFNPSKPDEKVGEIHLLSADAVAQAVQWAHDDQEGWRTASVDTRVGWLLKLASILRKHRDELSAWMTVEVGKTWREADADVCEGIDFCEYYAREMMRLKKPILMQNIPGELNHLSYQGRGVCAVIAPWNFPFAILAGMSVAAAVTGNSVLIKPAEQSMVIASLFVQCAHQAGIPISSFQLLYGYGETVGAALTRHPQVNTIAFTGSRAVGLEIYKQAGITHPGQRSLKRVICEMGGKNALIVDSDADLDEAVLGVIQSAFGFAGQKCSACSRVIVVDPLYTPFVDRLKAAVESLKVGASTDPSVSYGPVIDDESYERLTQVIEDAKQRGTVLTGGIIQDQEGYLIAPTLITDLDWDDPLVQNEHFGPVLSLHQVDSFTEALQRANQSEYALTGGIFSRSPSNIHKARSEFRVGNLYINRSITGAIVGRQPFGGFLMSGGGTKAGGPDYLLNFMNPRTITENTQRRGFAPETEE